MKWMVSSRFLLRKGWYFPSVFVFLTLWILSLGPGLYDPSPYAPYRIYFPSITEESLRETDALEQDSLKQMVLFSVEMVRKHNWNYQLFSSVCHSKPERSVFLNGWKNVCTKAPPKLWLLQIHLKSRSLKKELIPKRSVFIRMVEILKCTNPWKRMVYY